MLVVIKGAGDIATGVACRLKNSGFNIIMLETKIPTTIRRTVAFSRCVYKNSCKVEGIKGFLAKNIQEARIIAENGNIAVLIDENGNSLKELKPEVVIDAILAKVNIGTSINDAKIVIALGPGFIAGKNCHSVIETKRGHELGRCIYSGSAIPNTGIPGSIGGYGQERILRAPEEGIFEPILKIGDVVKVGDVVAMVNSFEIKSEIDGIIRGLLQQGVMVKKGMKSGDIDPREIYEHCFTVSDKARAIGGGVLEAIMSLKLKEN